MPEKNLDDFFRGETKEYKRETRKEKNVQKSNISKDGAFFKFFRDRFSFDMNVDLTDKCSVLYRRNYVIKNIIFLANLVFTIFSFIGLKGTGSSSNLIITIVFWLLMTTLSTTISVLLKNKKTDYNRQKLIMYVQCFYVFLLSVFLYVKIWLSYKIELNADETMEISKYSITQAAYLLIYFSILISALYQRPKLLRTFFPWIFVIMTILHITVLHPELYAHGDSFSNFIKYMFVEKPTIIIDIAVRSLVLLVYFAGLYSNVSISDYIAKERRSEFTRRLDVENSYVEVVKSVFEAVKVYNSNANEYNQLISSKKVSLVAKELSHAMAYDQTSIQMITDYAKIHTEKMKLLTLLDEEIKELDFDEIIEKTELATKIIKRLQLVKRINPVLLEIIDK